MTERRRALARLRGSMSAAGEKIQSCARVSASQASDVFEGDTNSLEQKG